MNRRSVTGFGFVARLRAKMNSEVPAWLVLGFIAAYVTVGALAAHRSQETRRLESMQRHESEDNAIGSNSNDLLRTMPGVMQPPVADPLEISWSGEEEVVGVTVNGQSRAYLVEALSRPDYHIINDMIGLVPVSITYCNINRCPLRVHAGGCQDAARPRGRRTAQLTGAASHGRRGTVLSGRPQAL